MISYLAKRSFNLVDLFTASSTSLAIYGGEYWTAVAAFVIGMTVSFIVEAISA